MKKNTKLLTGLLTFLALILGFVIGLFIEYPQTNSRELSGAIGKVDKYRNVKVTEDDIKLRNELVDDSAKQATYEMYLQYNYYKAIRTFKDVKSVLEMTSSNEEFYKNNNEQLTKLENYQIYLKSAREDILEAMHLISNLNKDKKVPVINHLNKANDAISRIKNNESLLTDYAESIANYTEKHQDTELANLKNAHDILTFNLMQSAIISKDKPMLAYLGNKALLNDSADVKKLNDSKEFTSYSQDKYAMDAEELGISGFKDAALGVNENQEDLNLMKATEILRSDFTDSKSFYNASPDKGLQLRNREFLADIQVWSTERLSAFTNYDAEKLQALLNQNKSLQMFYGQEMLNWGVLDAENLGLR